MWWVLGQKGGTADKCVRKEGRIEVSTERYGHKGFTSFQQGQGDLKALLFYWILLSPRHIQNIKFRQVNLKSVSNLTRNDFDCGKNCYVYVKPIIASSIRSFYFSKLSFNKQVEVWGAIAPLTNRFINVGVLNLFNWRQAVIWWCSIFVKLWEKNTFQWAGLQLSLENLEEVLSPRVQKNCAWMKRNA